MAFILTIREKGHSWAGRPPVTSVHLSRNEAREEVVAYVRRNWDAEVGDEQPDDPEELVRVFFSEVLEAYDIREEH